MFHASIRLIRKYLVTTRVRSLCKTANNMEHAYVRFSDPDRFLMTLRYRDKHFKVDRTFNFNRSVSETVSSFLGRIQTNIEKAVFTKKFLKTLTGNGNNKPEIKIQLKTVDGEFDADSPCLSIFSLHQRVLLNIDGQEYLVVVNAPWIDNVVLPKAMMSGFPVYPCKFEATNVDRKVSEFNWYKSFNKQEWLFVGTGFIYTPNNSDIGSFLKLTCIPKNEGREGATVDVISTVQVEANPGKCLFENRRITPKDPSGFRVMSYNILADLYCDSDFTRQELFPYCPPYALDIDYRKLLIVKELLAYNADVLCLQEVDRKVYLNDLKPVFENLGYESEFTVKGGKVVEGLACFYNTKLFKMENKTRVVLAEVINVDPVYSIIWKDIKKNAKLAERILNRTTAVQTLTLQSLHRKEIILLVNTHLYYHPDADHIRLLQSALIMLYIDKLYKEIEQQAIGNRISIIFCGDFNSSPDCGVYNLLTTGEVSENTVDFQSNLEESISGVQLRQPFLMGSAYGTPKFTNYTAGFADCLDYIFYEVGKLKVKSIVPLPSEEDIKEHTALPSIIAPSDHLALVSDFEWIENF